MSCQSELDEVFKAHKELTNYVLCMPRTTVENWDVSK